MRVTRSNIVAAIVEEEVSILWSDFSETQMHSNARR
jgi:hypothetical protein